MRRVLILGFTAAGCLLFTTMAAAQLTGNASITGTVRDTSGAVLPGVTVEAASPALIEKVRSTVTNDSGEYRIIELRPGTYTVTFTLPGFATFRREGLDLGTNFTATVNAELRVGAVEETVTVRGETPLVDIASVTTQRTISQVQLDAVPTGKGIFGFVALLPAVIVPTQFQDVGGGLADSTTRISVHGAKANDQRLAMDGLSFNMRNDNGTARGFFINPLSAQEIVIDTGGGGSAEYAVGGAVVSMISKDGGNTFGGTLFLSGSNDALQGDNFTDELRARGLRGVNQNLKIYDANAVIAGPIVKDRLWFMSAHRRHGQQHRVANLYRDANFDARTFGAPAAVWRFAPDLSRPVEPWEDNRAHNLRLTWQAATGHKVSVSYDWQWNKNQNNIEQLHNGTLALEANGAGGNFRCTRIHLVQGTWTHPATSRLLFEAGGNVQNARLSGPWCYSFPGTIQIRDTALNFTYGGTGVRTVQWQYPAHQRASLSYVTGAHNFKVGVLAAETLRPMSVDSTRGTIPFSYTFNNGVPTSITEFESEFDSPLHHQAAERVSLGLFAQDQWRIRRLSLNLGLRYEYGNFYAPADVRTAGPLTGEATFAEVTCLPCWRDLNPRLAVVYDLFGDGKTALKASLGRYSGGLGTTQAETFRPRSAVVASTTRSWGDSNGNFFPDCDLRNPLVNGECGPMANQTFGQVQIRTRPDPEWITGWHKRNFNWQASVSLDRELRPGVALNVGYYRTWFGNFTVTDNLLVTPANYDPYCITAPTDSRLPANISGQQICGFYDINPSKFGQVDNLITLAKHFGKQTEVYNGGDVGLTLRLPNRAQISGGWNVGNSISLPAGTGVSSSRSNQCFVVDSPQQLYNCETQNPYQHRFKINGFYPLPWDLQAAVVFQSLPGPPYTALFTVTTAQIAPSLGRNLAGGTRTVTIDLLPTYSAFLDERVNQLDLRLSKMFRFGKTRIQGNFDLYNALNSSTVLQLQQQYGPRWLEPTQIMPARLVKFGVQVDF